MGSCAVEGLLDVGDLSEGLKTAYDEIKWLYVRATTCSVNIPVPYTAIEVMLGGAIGAQERQCHQ